MYDEWPSIGKVIGGNLLWHLTVVVSVTTRHRRALRCNHRPAAPAFLAVLGSHSFILGLSRPRYMYTRPLSVVVRRTCARSQQMKGAGFNYSTASAGGVEENNIKLIIAKLARPLAIGRRCLDSICTIQRARARRYTNRIGVVV